MPHSVATFLQVEYLYLIKETEEVLKAAPSGAEIWREAKSQHMRSFAEPTICQHYFLTFVEKVLAK